MSPELQSLLDDIHRQGAANDATQTDYAQRMLNLEPDTARLIALLARAAQAKRILEIGTSNAYSTLWLAWAIRPFAGKIISIDRLPQKHALARANLARAGFLDSVELRLGDATAIVRELTGPFDLVFFDADRLSAPEQLRLLLPKLSPRALILADNALSHPAEIAPYLATVAALPHVEHAVIPVGKGLSLASRITPE